MKLAVAIPAYNEGSRIGTVIRDIIGLGYTVVVINDGSPDNTAAAALEAGAEVISHPTNRGKAEGLRTAFKWAKNNGVEALVTMDGDGQHSPLDFQNLVQPYLDGQTDFVLGYRNFLAPGVPWIRSISNRFSARVMSFVAGYRFKDAQSGYRLITIAAWERINPETGRFEMEAEVLAKAAWLGLRISQVPIQTIYGDEKSKFRAVEDSWRFLRLAWNLWRRKPKQSFTIKINHE